ncbi:MAG: hypothetical protein QW734_07820 [Candidatus Bathyarchaeia archaeon]
MDITTLIITLSMIKFTDFYINLFLGGVKLYFDFFIYNVIFFCLAIISSLWYYYKNYLKKGIKDFNFVDRLILSTSLLIIISLWFFFDAFLKKFDIEIYVRIMTIFIVYCFLVLLFVFRIGYVFLICIIILCIVANYVNSVLFYLEGFLYDCNLHFCIPINEMTIFIYSAIISLFFGFYSYYNLSIFRKKYRIILSVVSSLIYLLPLFYLPSFLRMFDVNIVILFLIITYFFISKQVVDAFIIFENTLTKK